MKIKYRIMAQVKKDKCGSCGPDKWLSLGTTLDPRVYQAEHPTWILKFERVGLSSKVRIVG